MTSHLKALVPRRPPGKSRLGPFLRIQSRFSEVQNCRLHCSLVCAQQHVVR